MSWDLEPGDRIRRSDLHDEYGGGRQGGIAPCRRSDNVLIFSDPEVGGEYGYHDHWDGDVFHYVGEGRTGDQEMTHGNGAILNHVAEGRTLRLFWGAGGIVEYFGEVELVEPEPWYPAKAGEWQTTNERSVITFRLQLADGGDTYKPGHTPADSNRRLPTPKGPDLATPYEEAKENTSTRPRKPFAIDPNKVDRALAGHATTQNLLASAAQLGGCIPLSPGPSDPDFDLAWMNPDGTYTVVEVKSLTPFNQDRQLRLGLGQVLDYRHVLTAAGKTCQAVLAVETAPTHPRWLPLCSAAGVSLIWPDTFPDLFPASS